MHVFEKKAQNNYHVLFIWHFMNDDFHFLDSFAITDEPNKHFHRQCFVKHLSDSMRAKIHMKMWWFASS